MINLSFLTEGKLAAIFIKPSLGVPNWPVIYFINSIASNSFLAPLLGKSGRPLQGEFFAHTSFTLFYSFALLYLFYLHRFISKTQKN
jgi:hypothetical protein